MNWGTAGTVWLIGVGAVLFLWILAAASLRAMEKVKPGDGLNWNDWDEWWSLTMAACMSAALWPVVVPAVAVWAGWRGLVALFARWYRRRVGA